MGTVGAAQPMFDPPGLQELLCLLGDKLRAPIRGYDLGYPEGLAVEFEVLYQFLGALILGQVDPRPATVPVHYDQVFPPLQGELVSTDLLEGVLNLGRGAGGSFG